jgi:drug/metabolite transporter (DMT)-like permease
VTLAVVFALAAALANTVNLMTQHSASSAAPANQRGWDLVQYLFRQPLWLLGWIAAGAGFGFQALALHYGQLSVVQPVLISELVFGLVLRRIWIRQDVAAAAWASALVTCVALAVFLSVAEPTGGQQAPEAAEWVSVLLVLGGFIAVLTLGARHGSPTQRAALYAVAASVTWALMATFIKTATDTLATSGLVGMLTNWAVYALALAALVGTLLEQAALRFGPLRVSQPLLVVVNPFVSIILSVWLFDERFTGTATKVVVAAIAFAGMVIGVVMLSRTAPPNLDATRAPRP